ncbi:amino acid ABC transporter substrate-binding protein [Roseobacter cerasinus]|uniref:Amino acid ABC transporter substrate-binding protein n=2 Tax=Roseobacter cerasinus TaxID=2602289 RepID=A0A640VSG7_9RHOB|nr:ABC transporter substrate-binding protein [Roseobacter cerasinus]GFE50554.1 amino acid ABC transporter substrate-binding protein [Roseobacter cerasinus]
MWMKVTGAALGAMMLAGAVAAQSCSDGKTLTEGKLTIATGNPAYYPWVIDDAPESGKGFEAAVAYALAEAMGFASEDVVWTRTSFDQAIQPGAKDFDLNMQQFSITEQRDKVVDFSAPYYTAPMAVLVRGGGDLSASLDALKQLRWGVVASTTALPMVTETIQPDASPLVYDDNANVVEAMKAGQVDAALFDLPTALYLSAVVLEGGQVLGQFAPDESANPDHFGALMTEGNPLKDCVDAALEALKSDGSLAAIEAEWLQQATGVPLIE